MKYVPVGVSVPDAPVYVFEYNRELFRIIAFRTISCSTSNLTLVPESSGM